MDYEAAWLIEGHLESIALSLKKIEKGLNKGTKATETLTQVLTHELSEIARVIESQG